MGSVRLAMRKTTAYAPAKVQTIFLVLAAVILIVGLACSEETGLVRSPLYDQQARAAKTMLDCMLALREARTERGMVLDPELDPNLTGLIGAEFTPLTTTLGVLEAKRTATNPAFAALMVKLFASAGLKRGDVVAIGASGSFPSLILATLAACRVLELQPVLIYSVGASMYGANLPDFTFADMLHVLNQRGLLPYTIAAVSLGGEGDAAGGVMGGDAEVFEGAAARSGARVLMENTLAQSIRRRLEVFSEAALAEGRSVSCFVNIGGATANYGNTAASLSFPNGLTTRPPVMSAHPERGLIFEYSAMGMPVVNLIDVRGLALKNGLPIDPIPFPPIGEGGVYHVRGRSRATAAVALAGGAALLVIGVWLARRSSGNDPVLSQ